MAHRKKLTQIVEELGKTHSAVGLAALGFLHDITKYAKSVHGENTMNENIAQRIYHVFSHGIKHQAYNLPEQERKHFVTETYIETAQL